MRKMIIMTTVMMQVNYSTGLVIVNFLHAPAALTPEKLHPHPPYILVGSGVPRNFFGGGRVNKFSLGQRTERTGIWGR